jgi:hypothetical protein
MPRTVKGRHRRRRDARLGLMASAVALGILTTPASPATYPGTSLPASVPYAIHVGGRDFPRVPVAEAGRAGGEGPGSTRAAAAFPGSVAGSNGRFRVVIPRIGVDAPVIDLGLNPDGTLQVPSNFAVAGWYAGGPEPGDVGPAVIVGHVDSRNGPAVFFAVRSLGPGDAIDVFEGGRKMRFVVLSVQEYAKDAFPTTKVYGRVDYPALRLITCGGVFNTSTGHYTDNIVVYGKLT